MPTRLAHVRAAGEKAGATARQLCPDEEALLTCAGVLHDIGYSPALALTGFHPLDGARWLRDLGEERLACLAAHHSGARWEAGVRGLRDQLAEFTRERSLVSDILAYADMTTGPNGDLIGIDERIADIRRRYPAGDPVAIAIWQAEPSLRRTVARVDALLAEPVLS